MFEVFLVHKDGGYVRAGPPHRTRDIAEAYADHLLRTCSNVIVGAAVYPQQVDFRVRGPRPRQRPAV